MKAREQTTKNAFPLKEPKTQAQGGHATQKPKQTTGKTASNCENLRPKTPNPTPHSSRSINNLKSTSQTRVEKSESRIAKQPIGKPFSAIDKSPRAKSSRNIPTKTTEQTPNPTVNYFDDGAKEYMDDANCDQESDKLLDSLREGCRKQYDPTRLNDQFMKILNNPNRKETQNFMPKGKCQHKSDGRQFMQVGDTEIFFDNSVLEDIINFGMRSKVSAMCNTN